MDDKVTIVSNAAESCAKVIAALSAAGAVIASVTYTDISEAGDLKSTHHIHINCSEAQK